MNKLVILATVLFLSSATFAEQPAPEQKNGNELSLPLYQKIKGHLDSLYGVQSPLLAGVNNKEESLKSLKADAAENKDALLKALGSASVIHRELAARALEYCGDKKAAISALSKTVNDDQDDNVRRAAAAALAKLPDAAAVEALMKALGDSSDSVRGISATALGNIKDPRAAQALLHVLEVDAKPMVRMQAATALGKIKEKSIVEKLTKAMADEKDERVKIAIAGAVRNTMGGDSKRTEGMPTADGAANELASLAKEMKEVEEKLRGDRHDLAVQVQGQGIEKKLAVLIEQIEKSCSSSSQSDKKEQQQQQQKQGNAGNSGKSGQSPLRESRLGGAVPPGAQNAAQVAGKSDAWAKLPPAQRDELLQAFREDMPERWRKRLEAYFLSIAAEEAKDTGN